MGRNIRRHASEEVPDHRQPAQRDRDRVLYADEFRRLAQVTQVVDPIEGYVFHNRLTHSLEVAQIGRRLAERLVAKYSGLAKKAPIDPDVVEAASLIHDLGHPPFGHIGEKTLDEISRKAASEAGLREFEGFEGNAQSFRIITRLSTHADGYCGLNLTRATMNATLKYPWFRATDGIIKSQKKYSAYRSEQDDFDFARQGMENNHSQCLEAAIMDYADDVTYSVHDFFDLSRANLLPTLNLLHDDDEKKSFFQEWQKEYNESDLIDKYKKGLMRLLKLINIGAYRGSREERVIVRKAISRRIKSYVEAVKLHKSSGVIRLQVPERIQTEIDFLKRIVWHYVITSSQLATQQEGYKEIVKSLFSTYLDAIKNREKKLIPYAYHTFFDECKNEADKIRLAVDIVAGMPDAKAVNIYRKIKGFTPGSISDLIEM